MTDTARYLYAITRGIDPARLTGTDGIGGARLEAVEHRGLSAIVSTVDLEEYGEEGLRQNLERLDWLEDVARMHDGVVQAVAEQGATAPLRLATICLDDQAVRQRLEEWHSALEQVLDRVEGRMEWSVKVVKPARLPGSNAPTPEPAATSGAAYLRRKKELSEARLSDEEAALGVAEHLHALLAGWSVASRRLPPQDPRLTGHEGTMVLNAAYLVETDAQDAFESKVAELVAAHPDVQIEHRGPWPPYSFAVLEQTQ